MKLLANYNVVVGTSNSFAIMSGKSNSRITSISGGEQRVISSGAAIRRSTMTVKNLNTCVIIDIEKLIKRTSGNRSSIDHKLTREASAALSSKESKMSCLRDLNRIAVTLSHGIQTANNSFTSDTGVISVKAFKRVGVENYADRIPSGSGRGHFKTRIELA